MDSSVTPWRPPQWRTISPVKVIIGFPGQSSSAPQYSSVLGGTVTLPSSPTLYAFDTELAIDHSQDVVVTEHPVQSGASISDHAYVQPARLTIDVGMSDAMDAYFSPSTWSGDPSKSVSAYQTMLALQFSRIPLQITTKLRSYYNMVITSLPPQETAKTFGGLRMRVSFQQIFLASITVTPVDSSRDQTTDSTNQGIVYPQPPTAATDQQNIQNAKTLGDLWNVIGAGMASSVPLSNSTTLPAK